MYEGVELRVLEWFEASNEEPQSRLDVFNKVSYTCLQTDFYNLVGGAGCCYSDNTIDYNSACTYTLTAYRGSHSLVVIDNDNGEDVSWEATTDNGAIRPVLELSPELFEEITKNRHNYGGWNIGVYFGHYMDGVPEVKLHNQLEKLFEKGKLKKVPGSYTFNVAKYNEGIELKTHDVYEYKGKKYIRMQANLNFDDSNRKEEYYVLKNGKEYRDDEWAWVEINDVEWLVDDKSKLLICVHNLASKIPFDDKKTFDGTFSKTVLYDYMNTYMVHDLFQYTNLKLNRSKAEVEPLLHEISRFSKYNLGNDDIEAKVSRLINSFNRKVTRLSKEDKNDIKLNVTYRSEDMLYNELIDNLKGILNQLKSDYEKAKPYYILEDSITGSANNELAKFIRYVKTVLENSLIIHEKEELTNDFNKVMQDTLDKCSAGVEGIKKGENGKSLDEVTYDFRKDLHPFLVKLNSIVEKRNIVEEIMKGIKFIVEDNYEEAKNVRAKHLLDEIQEVAKTVKQRGNNADHRKLKEILSFEVDYSKSLVEIFHDLNEKFKQVYNIELEINERDNAERKLDKTVIKVDVHGIFGKERVRRRTLSKGV